MRIALCEAHLRRFYVRQQVRVERKDVGEERSVLRLSSMFALLD